jgi:multiple sugar transport system permease protein
VKVFSNYSNITKSTRRQYILFLLLIAPAFLLRILTAAYPIIQTIYLGFTNTNALKGTNAFIGLENYFSLPTNFNFISTLNFTVTFILATTIVDLILGMLIALFLNSEFRGRSFARVINLIPWAIPTIVAGYAFRWLLDDQYGLIPNWINQIFGFSPVIFISPLWARVTVILVHAWKNSPFVALVLLAGLQGVPTDIYDAAKVDGANSWQRFWRITFPLILPLTVTMVIFWLIWQLANFDLVYGLTFGGPGTATTLLALQIFREGIMFFKYGFASSLSVVLLILVAIIGVFGLWFYRRVEVNY